MGDVWYRVSVLGVHEDVLTITRIDHQQDIVSGYDGLAHHTKGDLLRGPPRMRMSYTKFLKVHRIVYCSWLVVAYAMLV